MKASSLHIVVCGETLFSNIIADTLRNYPHIETTNIKPTKREALSHIVALKPDIVIIERHSIADNLFVNILHQGFQVMSLDIHHSMISLLNERQLPVFSINDLVTIIDTIIDDTQSAHLTKKRK